MSTIFDYRSTVSWEMALNAIEQIEIFSPYAVSGAEIIKFDSIKKASLYEFTPITRGRSEFSTLKTVGYRVNIGITVLFNDLGTYVPTLEKSAGRMVGLDLNLSTKNTSGMNKWNLILLPFKMNFSYSIKKGELMSELTMNFKGILTRSEMVVAFSYWDSGEPS